MGKFFVGIIVISAILAGGGIYYLQVYAYYEPVTISDNPSSRWETQIQLTLQETDLAEPIPVNNFEGIDADSSPLRFRACFTTGQSWESLNETYVRYDDPVPLIGPNWFECFDAKEIGLDLENGLALAFLSKENITYGIDRIIAVYEDGRAFAWHQINACGEVVFNGEPVPEGCPKPPERSN